MCRTTNLLLTLISISIFPFFTNGALQPQHQHAHGGGCNPDERATLLSFKKGITSNDANILTSWQGQDCCRWRGVSCSNRTGHVIKLHLRNPNVALDTYGEYDVCGGASALFGEISPSLLSLKHLEHMDLSMNCLLGTNSQIPHLLGSMGNLRYLNLSGIPFTGRVPPHLGNLSKLQYLDLGQDGDYSDMYSTDITWLTKLAFLKFLGMSGVNLSGIVDWPQTLNMIPPLRVIDLSYCLLDSANQSLAHLNLTKLEKLDLSYNDFEHSLASGWFWKATSLNNGINGDIASVFVESLPQCTWKSLQKLDLSYNNFTGTLPNFISGFTSLRTLSLSGNSLAGPIPPQLGNLTCLTSLDLSSNHFTGSIPDKLGNLRRTLCKSNKFKIDLSYNNLKMVLNSDWRAPFKLASARFVSCQMGPLFPPWLQQLKTTALDISSNAIKKSICKLEQLVYLDLSNNILEGEIPQCFDICNIEFLILGNNSLSGKIPTFLQNNTDMKFLDLAWNKFSGRLPTWIGKLVNLRFLILSHNKFSDNIPVDITKLGYLQYLDLSGNNFSGAIPWHQPNQTFMTTLLEKSMDLFVDVAYDFPALNKEEIGAERLGQTLSVNTKGQQLTYHRTLAYFVSIDLSCNSLTGEIPAYITSLVALMSLNLSSNQLSGQIPNMMGAMQSLESLDLSQNKLSGEIPSSLTNLTSLSYLDLSYNSLSGRIPSGPQLDTLSAENQSLILSGRIPSGPQLDTLSAENQSLMYIGNSGLCGPPVHKNCSGNDPSIHGDLERSKEEFDPLTFYFGLLLGFVVGLWMVFCALLFKKTWRIAYFRLFDKVYDHVYVFVVVKWASITKNTDAE
uniref:Leucine-rich repeat receptor protein kinase EXS n=1 Tax=Aegilops tauschii TaxID=37682 RepID=R7WFK1_AEGTA